MVGCYTGNMAENEFYTYMLECADGTLYTGWSTDPKKRFEQHNLGKGAKYTRARRPVILRAVWAFPSKAEAMRFEYELKRLSRPQKLNRLQTSLPLSDFETLQ